MKQQWEQWGKKSEEYTMMFEKKIEKVLDQQEQNCTKPTAGSIEMTVKSNLIMVQQE